MRGVYKPGIFGKRFREALQQIDKTQSEFAEEVRYSKSTVSNWVTGRSFPGLDDLTRICQYLGVSSDYLLGLDIPKPNEHEHRGIRWIERVPDYIVADQREEIEVGIDLFWSLVVENHNLDELREDPHFADYDWVSLPATFKVAVRSGAFQLTKVPRDRAKEQELLRLFPNLRKALVASVPEQYDESHIRAEFVAFLAATEALPILKGREGIGLGPGYTMLRFAELSVPSVAHFSGTRWIPLVASAASRLGTHTANYVALLMASRHPRSEALYLPYMHTNSSSDDREQFEKVFRACQNANAVFATVNGSGRKPRARNQPVQIEQFRAADGFTLGNMTGLYRSIVDKGLEESLAGEFMGLMLDFDARPIVEEENSRAFFQVKLDVIRSIAYTGLVWIVASGLYKAKPTLMVLQNELANALIVDSEIADYLISRISLK